MGEVWKTWLDLVTLGAVTHSSDNLLNYALMVKNGLGIGLLATCAMADPTAVPLELGVHIRAPLYAMAPAERFGTKAVQVVFDWLSEIFGETVPWFSPELKLDHLPRDALSSTVDKLFSGPRRIP
jgi:DNA-binding transcriptional LysR family regulator